MTPNFKSHIYNLTEQVDKQRLTFISYMYVYFRRKHYLCISAPAMPLPDTPPSPGPGSYEMVDYEGAPRHYMSGAAFVSTTSRWNSSALKNSELPGPG